MHTGFTQFPNIYFGGEHIGGIDDLKSHFMTKQHASRILRDNGIKINVTTMDDFDFENTSVSETDETEEFRSSSRGGSWQNYQMGT